ncbi:MAG: DUF2157 domain-containing protein [Pyrinomonadaceae bacterium]
MTENPPPSDKKEIVFSPADIQRAAAEGVLSQADADNLVRWGYDQHFNQLLVREPQVPAPEQRKGFNLVTVAYYFGAMLMISACAWFLGDKWNALGPPGIFATVLVYMLVALSLGAWLRRKGFVVGGGLLITVGVSLIPLLTYTVEKMTGFWPAQDPGSYEDFYPLIHGSWIVMELTTIAAAALTLRFVHFGFLTAPLAFCFWFLSMDIAALIYGQNYLDWQTRQWVSVAVGLITMTVGYLLERVLRKRGAPLSEDFAFWCYLFGLMAFWGGLTSMNSNSELKRLVYALINLGLIGIAVKLKRATFMVFGAVGFYIYLGHLAFQIFQDSVFFPFVLALLGLSMIMVTVWVQRRMIRVSRTSQT